MTTVPEASKRSPDAGPVPVWLLDIDGVLNAAVGPGRPPTQAWPKDQWIDTSADAIDRGRAKPRTWRILAAKPVVDFIRSVHESGRAEIRWHTTWQDLAREVSQALKLPEFAVQDAPEFWAIEEELRRDRWWKLPAVWRVLTDGRRVLWTDDDAEHDLKPQQKATLAAAGCHIVSPNPMTGLCKRHLREIDEYLGGVA